MTPAPKSPALLRICDAAILHFAEKGYDGASLNEIAGMVGIRKASLYSHVSGKDELFLLALEAATAAESAFAGEILGGPAPEAGPGSAYVEAVAARYEEAATLRFLLRAAYLPPSGVRRAIGEAYEGFLELLRAGFLRQTPEALPEAERESLGVAYLGIVESLYVELLYAGRAPMEARRRALWRMLTDSLNLRLRA